MNIVMVTSGSRGDIQPIMTLALGLQSKGHSIKLVGPPENEQWAREYNCPYHPFGCDVMALQDKMNRHRPIEVMTTEKQFWKEEINTQFKLLPQVAAKADLIISSSLTYAASSAAEKLKIPHRRILFSPQWFLLKNKAIPLFNGSGLNTLAIHYTQMAIKISDKFFLLKMINHNRKEMGLTPIKDTMEQIIFGQNFILACDPEISNIRINGSKTKFFQTGYMHLKQTKKPNKALDNFLNAGPPPVYAGFGSMSKMELHNSAQAIVNAARLAGQRVVIGKYWQGPPYFSDSKDVFLIDDYPHMDLFPHMAAVIHHGGAGTTATAAACGVPQIIVPFILDQFYWGYEVYKAHLGPKSILRLFLNTRKLAKAIMEAISNKQIRKCVDKTAQKIQQRDSVEMTIDTLFHSLN